MSAEKSPLLTYAPPAKPRRAMMIGIRMALVAAGLTAWFVTQGMIGSRHAATGNLPIESDGVLNLLTPVHTYLRDHVAAQNALLISSSAIIDLLAVFLLLRAIFGPTIRPFLGLLIVFGLRQIFQAVCVLPRPDGMIWNYPGFPSLLVTYGVSNDLFFSGHTALAVFGAVELARIKRSLIPVGIAIALFEVIAVLALRAHWTMDVYAGAITSLLVAFIAGPLSRPVDNVFRRFAPTERSAQQ